MVTSNVQPAKVSGNQNISSTEFPSQLITNPSKEILLESLLSPKNNVENACQNNKIEKFIENGQLVDLYLARLYQHFHGAPLNTENKAWPRSTKEKVIVAGKVSKRGPPRLTCQAPSGQSPLPKTKPPPPSIDIRCLWIQTQIKSCCLWDPKPPKNDNWTRPKSSFAGDSRRHNHHLTHKITTKSLKDTRIITQTCSKI